MLLKRQIINCIDYVYVYTGLMLLGIIAIVLFIYNSIERLVNKIKI